MLPARLDLRHYYPQFTRNCTPQNDNFFIFRVILNGHILRYAFFVCLDNEKFSPFAALESEGVKFVLGKALLNDMCLAYMELKQRSRTHILCLLTV